MVKRTLLGLVGAVLVLVGGIGATFAAWGYLTFADGGSLRYDLGTIVPGPDDAAIVIDVDRFGVSIPYLDAYGSTSLAVRSREPGEPRALFVGAASTTDADAFVRGVPYAVALADASGWQVRLIPGSSPLPPASAAPWLTDATGPTVLIDVPGERPLTLVLARPDGSPVGAVGLAADFAVPQARTAAMWLGIASALAIVAGVVLLVLAFRRRAVVAVEPVVAEPVVAEPVVAEPVAAEPVAAEPVAVEPVAVEPVVAEPVVAEPVEVMVVDDDTAQLPVVLASDPIAEEPDDHQPT